MQPLMPVEGDGFATYILMNEIFKLIEPTYYSAPYVSISDFFSRLIAFFKLLLMA